MRTLRLVPERIVSGGDTMAFSLAKAILDIDRITVRESTMPP